MSGDERASGLVVPDGSDPKGGFLLSWGDAMTWDEYELMVDRTLGPFEGRFEQRYFDYVHPVSLQGHWPSHQVKPTAVRMAYTDWAIPTVLCSSVSAASPTRRGGGTISPLGCATIIMSCASTGPAAG